MKLVPNSLDRETRWRFYYKIYIAGRFKRMNIKSVDDADKIYMLNERYPELTVV